MSKEEELVIHEREFADATGSHDFSKLDTQEDKPMDENAKEELRQLIAIERKSQYPDQQALEFQKQQIEIQKMHIAVLQRALELLESAKEEFTNQINQEKDVQTQPKYDYMAFDANTPEDINEMLVKMSDEDWMPTRCMYFDGIRFSAILCKEKIDK